jgi:hypothetical protein
VSASGPKLTLAVGTSMTAYDPKRTFEPHAPAFEEAGVISRFAIHDLRALGDWSPQRAELTIESGMLTLWRQQLVARVMTLLGKRRDRKQSP